ncbi:MAG: Hsp70 family protein, partial [Ruminococcus sp.]|nr:Hsp70 family protein [Ruminococcus sp.]
CAEKAGGEPVDKVFITYPASYLEHDKRKRKIIGAAKAAGLFDIVLVDEPTAAAMNYLEEGNLPRDAKNLMIYDFGGGTFDVSLIRCDHGQLDLICDPGGDPECGGVDMDRAIYEDIAAAMNAQFTDVMQMVAGNPTQMKRLQFQIQEAAVKAKHQLTTGGIVQQTIPVGFDLLTYTLTRESFERMIAPLAAKSITACRNILQSANMKIEDLSAILMVGGTSRVPLVQSMLKQFAGKTPVLTAKNMDLAVVVGALKYREKPAADEKAKR